jgi:predicted DNA-binding transcriptional regulator AlpA
MTEPQPDGLMTVDEVAAETTLATETLYSWRSLNKGPRSFKLGARVVYRRSEVAAWLAAQENTTTRGGTS